MLSAVLVVVGLYIRLQIAETPAFRESLERNERVRIPFVTVFARQPLLVLLGAFGAATTFVVFYLVDVFALGWTTSTRGFPRREFLLMQLLGVVCFGLGVPLAGDFSDRVGGQRALIVATVLALVFGFAFEPLFGAPSRRFLAT